MVAVKIPGADQIEQVAPARDPGVRADPSDFGADIGAGLQHLGNAAVSLGAHLYQKRQSAQDEVYSSTYDVTANPALTQTVIDTKKQFPDGGPGFMEALQSNLDKTHADVTATLAQKGLQPSEGAAATVTRRFNALKADYLVKGVVVANNEKVAGLQSQLNDNVDAVKSSVLSGGMSLDDALKSVETNAASGKGLYSGSQLVEQKDKWQQGVIDAAIRNRYNSGDKAGGDALVQKYYGGVPKYGDSNAAGVARVAQNLGVSPRDLAAVISYETGGRFDPTMMGGKGNNYQGLIQFGPEERAKYGVKPGQSFQDQLPAVENFLRDRGVKPGMSLAQIYSVVNAGSLDKNDQPRWAASDGGGNIASHVQKIQRDHYASADKFLSGAARAGVKIASTEGDVAIPGKPNADASGDSASDSSGDSAPVLPNTEKALYWRQQSHAVDIDQKQAAERQAAAAKAASDARELDVFKDIHSTEPKMSAVQILDDPYLSKDAKEKLYNIKATTTVNKAETTYGPGFMNVYQRIHLPDGSPEKITDPSSLYSLVGQKDGLTVAGVDKLVGEINSRKTPEGVAEAEMKKQFLTYAKGKISGTDEGLHLKDPKGDELYLKFLAQAWPAFEAGKKAGKTAGQLLNPDSPDYIGKGLFVQGAGFVRPMNEWFGDMVNGNQTPGAASTAPAAFDPAKVKSLPELMAAYRAGNVSRSIASEIAIAKGWASAAPAAAVPVSQFGSVDAGQSSGPDALGGPERFTDFRRSDNVIDRRAESGSVKERIRELFFGKEATYGALTPKEFNGRMSKYTDDELSKLLESGGPSLLAKALGFNDIGKKSNAER